MFNFQTWTKADDIIDFQIEGMSVGDSLLNYMSENEIKNKSTDTFYYKNKKYLYRYYPSLDFLKDFDSIQISFKAFDQKYIIEGIAGVIRPININKCSKKSEEIKKELDTIFKTKAIFDKGDHSGHEGSTYKRFTYKLNQGHVVIICYDMSKKFEKLGKKDSLYISMNSINFINFLTQVQYK